MLELGFFSVPVSEQLAKESQVMEQRLQQLQDRLQKQQQEDSASGKSNWKSARVEKGGLGSYGKDLDAKNKKTMQAAGVTQEAFLKSTAGGRRTTRQAAQGNFKTKGKFRMSYVFWYYDVCRSNILDCD